MHNENEAIESVVDILMSCLKFALDNSAELNGNAINTNELAILALGTCVIDKYSFWLRLSI